jgi:hypothetical protein
MIEGISAITLATHAMASAVQFYRSLGFDILYGGESATFTSFRAGAGYLNLIAEPEDKHWSWWGVSSSMSTMSTRFITERSPQAGSPRPCRAMPNGVSATSISAISMVMN